MSPSEPRDRGRRPLISVVVNSLNEGARIGFTLRSVRPWVDEMVVVDMDSDDDTAKVARDLGARVVRHDRVGFVEPVRAFSCAQARGEWILLLDADEVVPARLASALLLVAAEDAADVVRIPRLNHILGGPLLHSGWNPERDRHARFFKAGQIVFSDVIHEPPRARPGARVQDLPFEPGNALVHFNYTDVSQFLGKLDTYTSIEALQAVERGDSPDTLRTLTRALREFAVRYLWHGGWRDGWRGIHLCLLMFGYAVVRSAKIHELAHTGGRGAVTERYRREAEALIEGVLKDVAKSGDQVRTRTDS